MRKREHIQHEARVRYAGSLIAAAREAMQGAHVPDAAQRGPLMCALVVALAVGDVCDQLTMGLDVNT